MKKEALYMLAGICVGMIIQTVWTLILLVRTGFFQSL